MEENIVDIVHDATKMVASYPGIAKIPDELKEEIVWLCVRSHMIGYHQMWCSFSDKQPDDEYISSIDQMMSAHHDQIYHVYYEYEKDMRQVRHEMKQKSQEQNPDMTTLYEKYKAKK